MRYNYQPEVLGNRQGVVSRRVIDEYQIDQIVWDVRPTSSVACAKRCTLA
jgi:hypothetical protein